MGRIHRPDIGVMMLDTHFPRLKGDAGSPETYPCDVKMKILKKATVKRIVTSEPPVELLDGFIGAAKELEEDGVRLITTTCGFMIAFQEQLQSAVRVPLLTSSLLQLPFLLSTLPKHSNIGIITADSSQLNTRHFQIAGVASSDMSRLKVFGMQDCHEFKRVIIKNAADIDSRKLNVEVINVTRSMMSSTRSISAILLECTNLPPYADSLRELSGLPVFDFTTMIRAYCNAFSL